MTKGKIHIANSSSGFSLVEIAVVITAAAALLAAAVGLIKTWTDEAALATNQQHFTAIQQAIINYEAQNNRLPCASSYTAQPGTATFGRESTSCTGALAPGTYKENGRQGDTDAYDVGPPTTGIIIIGALPVRDLGLPDSYRTDAYGYMYTYAVTKSEALTNGLNGFAGAINVVETPAQPLASDNTVGTATYVVVDHGKDGKGAFTGAATGPAIKCPAIGSTQDSYNCSFESGAVANFAFYNAPFNNQIGAGTSWFDDTVEHSGSLVPNVKSCTTVWANSTTAGNSSGHNEGGIDEGTGYGATTFWGVFYYTDYLVFSDTPIGGANVSTSPTADALCPTTQKYTVVTGGCTQTYGTPTPASGPFTNIFGADLNSGFTAAGKYKSSKPSSNEQIVLPPASHPILGGSQGWECNGSSSNNIYTQAYAVCCTDGSN